jgi:hypothetical protein
LIFVESTEISVLVSTSNVGAAIILVPRLGDAALVGFDIAFAFSQAIPNAVFITAL